MANDRDQPELPRVEPEIIPPDRQERGGPGRGFDWRRPAWRTDGQNETAGMHRVYVARIGPRRGVLVDLRRRDFTLASGGRLADRRGRHFSLFALTTHPVILSGGHAEYTRR
jgi:hypothetical protein